MTVNIEETYPCSSSAAEAIDVRLSVRAILVECAGN